MARKISAYQRNLNRLYKQIRRMEQRYYTFPENIRETLKGKTARQLGQLKTEWLYRQAEHQQYDPETGEFWNIPGVEARKLERQASARKAAETRAKKGAGELPDDYYEKILADFEADMSRWLDAETAEYYEYSSAKGVKRVPRNVKDIQAEERAKNMLRVIYEHEKSADPKRLAKRIEAHSEQLGDYINKAIAYSYEEDIVPIAEEIVEIIKGTEPSFSERMGIDDMEDYDPYYDY